MMSRKTTEPCATFMEARVQYGGMSLCYRLLVIEDVSDRRYAVEATLGDERERASLGSDPKTAIDVFERVSAGAVTPCVLEEVVEDLLMSEKL